MLRTEHPRVGEHRWFKRNFALQDTSMRHFKAFSHPHPKRIHHWRSVPQLWWKLVKRLGKLRSFFSPSQYAYYDENMLHQPAYFPRLKTWRLCKPRRLMRSSYVDNWPCVTSCRHGFSKNRTRLITENSEVGIFRAMCGASSRFGIDAHDSFSGWRFDSKYLGRFLRKFTQTNTTSTWWLPGSLPWPNSGTLLLPYLETKSWTHGCTQNDPKACELPNHRRSKALLKSLKQQ